MPAIDTDKLLREEYDASGEPAAATAAIAAPDTTLKPADTKATKPDAKSKTAPISLDDVMAGETPTERPIPGGLQYAPIRAGKAIVDAVKSVPGLLGNLLSTIAKTEPALLSGMQPGNALPGTMIPRESAQGALNEALKLPSQIAIDLPNAVGSGVEQLLFGGPALTPEQLRVSKDIPNPSELLSSEAIQRVLEATGIGGKPESQLNEPERLQRQAGEFATSMLVPGGPDADMTRSVLAPIKSGIRKIGDGLPPITQAQHDREVGRMIQASRAGKPAPEALPSIPNVDPTAVQQDERLRNLHNQALKTDPTYAEALKQRDIETQKSLRGAVSDLGGTGTASDLAVIAQKRAAEADAAANASILEIREPKLGGEHGLALQPEEVSRQASARLGRDFQSKQKYFQDQYRRLGELGAQADMNVRPLVKELEDWEKSLSDADKLTLAENPKIRQRLELLKGYAKTAPKSGPEIVRYDASGSPLAEAARTPESGFAKFEQLRGLRSQLKTMQRELGGGVQPSADAARLAGKIEERLSKFMDNYEFPDKQLQVTYKSLNSAYREFAERYLHPLESRKALRTGKTGADIVSPEGFMKLFVEGGPEGAASVRTLMRMDGSHEMQELVASHLAEDFQARVKTVADADKWLRQYGPTLRELGNPTPGQASSAQISGPWFRKFSEVRDRVAAAEAIKNSQLGRLTAQLGQDAITPEALASSISKSSNPAAQIKELQTTIFESGGRTTPESQAAWSGFQRAYADHILSQITSREVVNSESVSKLLQKNAEALRVAFGDSGVELLQKVQKIARRLEDTRVRGTVEPVDKTFLDAMVDGIVGASVASVSSGVTGIVAGAGTHVARQALRKRATEALRRALLDKNFADDLERAATPEEFNKIPTARRALLAPFAQEAAKLGGRLAPLYEPERKPEPIALPTPKPKPQKTAASAVSPSKVQTAATNRPAEMRPSVAPGKLAAAQPAQPAAKPQTVAAAPSKRQIRNVGSNRWAITPTKNGRWIVEKLKELAENAAEGDSTA